MSDETTGTKFKIGQPIDKPQSWRKTEPFPKNNYPLRCIETKFAASNAGNDMVTLMWEIFAPEPVQFGPKKLDIDGLKLPTFHTITVYKNGEVDEEATQSARGYFGEFLMKCGWQEEDFDVDNPPHTFFKNIVMDAVVYGKKQASFQEPTPEERAQGKKIGKPIKDPSGKDVINYQLAVEQFFGRSSVEVNRPF